MPEYGLQFFQFQGRGYAEHALAVKATVCDENMAVRVEAENIAKGLDGDDCAGNGIFFVSGLLKEDLQRLPGAAAQIMRELEIPLKLGKSSCRRKPVSSLFKTFWTPAFAGVTT